MAVGTALLGAVAVPGGAAAAELVPIGTAEYSAPTHVTSPPGEPDRLIVSEQGGLIRQTTPAATTEYLDLTDETDSSGEEGLWSVAFAPDFAQSRLFYAAYTAGDGAPQVVEYREGASPAETEATARRVLKVEDNPATSNHNGGQLQFGPDGLLYWSVGDDANAGLAQDLTSLRGKLLRIDPRGADPDEYTVPSDNPFTGSIPGEDEIWSLGLRNPWRFSFDRLTDALTIGDVGSGAREEINHVAVAAGAGKGANFGWPDCEGRVGGGCANPAFTAPIYDYTNPSPGQAAVAGGYVVRDSDLGDLYGRYLFADTYDASALRSIDPNVSTPTDAHRSEALAASFITSFGEDSCGRLYVVSSGSSQVYRVEGPTGGACPPESPPPEADTTPPDTSLKLRKPKRRTKRVFELTSSEPNSRFECKRDRKPWRACESPRRLKRLGKGRHRFRARAIDAAGNVDPTPAKKRFKVKRRKRR